MDVLSFGGVVGVGRKKTELLGSMREQDGNTCSLVHGVGELTSLGDG